MVCSGGISGLVGGTSGLARGALVVCLGGHWLSGR